MGEEDRIQQECYIWFHNNHRHLRGLLFSVPNGGRRDPKTAKLLKATGLVPGVADLLFIYKGSVNCLECKTETGRQSKNQINWEIKVTGEYGQTDYYVFRNLDEFKEIINNIIKNDGKRR